VDQVKPLLSAHVLCKDGANRKKTLTLLSFSWAMNAKYLAFLTATVAVKSQPMSRNSMSVSFVKTKISKRGIMRSHSQKLLNVLTMLCCNQRERRNLQRLGRELNLKVKIMTMICTVSEEQQVDQLRNSRAVPQSSYW